MVKPYEYFARKCIESRSEKVSSVECYLENNVCRYCIIYLNGTEVSKNCLDWNMRWTSAIEESSPGNVILIDDAREFTEQNNYPTLKEVEIIVLGKKEIG